MLSKNDMDFFNMVIEYKLVLLSLLLIYLMHDAKETNEAFVCSF